MKLTTCALSLSLSLASPSPVLADVPIVRNGRPAAVILVADDASPVTHEAAGELARVIEKATGARLLIFPEDELIAKDKGYPADAASKILVGDTKMGRTLGVDLSALPAEGFVIRTTGRYLVLAGRDGRHADWTWRGHRRTARLRGTWYAVCAFLEDVVGARWLWPGELGEVVPKVKDIAVPEMKRTDAPKLMSRVLRANFAYGSTWRRSAFGIGLSTQVQFAMMQELIRWVDHQRLGSSLSIAHTEFSREWLDEFGGRHPDWFAMQPSGKRLLSYGGGYRVRMCLSHPGVIDESVRRTVAYLDAHPNVGGFGIAPSDVYGSYCVCERCKKWGPTTSDLVARHSAAVAERVAKLRPGKYVHALAYHKYNDAPESDVRLGSSVVLSYVGVDYFGYLCDRARQKSIKEWDGWAKAASKIVWRPNNFCQCAGVPRVYVTRLGDDFQCFHASNMIGVDFDRLAPNFALDGLNYYVTSRLTWNPEADVDAIVDDYCQKGFDAAAPAVREYFVALEAVTNRVAAERKSDRDARDIPGRYSEQDLSKLRDILNRAKMLAGQNGDVLARIGLLAEGLDFADVEVALHRAVESAKESKPSPERIEELRQLLERRKTLCRERCASWAVNVADLSRDQEWLEDQLFAPPKPGTFDDLPNAYDDIMTLPAQWKFKIDPNYVGEKEKWYALDHDDSAWADIRVGEFWEKQGYPDYDSAAWYRLKLHLPKGLKTRIVQLCFGAADENAKVYVNGKLSGEFDVGPEGWDKRFFIDITKEARPGEANLIAVRVIDTVGAGGLWKPVKVVTPKTTLHPVQDVWLRRSAPDTAYGRQPTLAIGAADYFRSALAWQLPEEVEVVSARVVMPLRYQTNRGSYALHAMQEDWYEPKATWQSPLGSKPWKGRPGAGAAISGQPVARAQHPPIDEEDAKKADAPPALMFDITKLAKEWIAGRPNHGVLIVQDPPSPNATCSPHSREATATLRPRLELALR